MMRTPDFLRKFVRWVDTGETGGTPQEESEQLRAGARTARTARSGKSGSAVSGRNSGKKRAPDRKTALPAGLHEALEKKRAEEASLPPKLHEKKARAAEKRHGTEYTVLSVFVCLAMLSLLLTTVAYLPEFGDPADPADNEVYERYVEAGTEETGAINTVAGMILDYRAFDTLGESNVLFIAVCSVLILLRADRSKDGFNIPELSNPIPDRVRGPILRAAALIIVPVGILFGIYVILNGHLSAGGGFSGGAVIGAVLILYVNAFGSERLEKYFTFQTYKAVTFLSLITYTGLKTYSFYTGANGLESVIGTGTPGAILSGGLILPLNICVGLVVACTMYAFYALFRKGGFGNEK